MLPPVAKELPMAIRSDCIGCSPDEGETFPQAVRPIDCNSCSRETQDRAVPELGQCPAGAAVPRPFPQAATATLSFVFGLVAGILLHEALSVTLGQLLGGP
jgi:hypothetical protein